MIRRVVLILFSCLAMSAVGPTPQALASHSDPKPNTVWAWYMDTTADNTLYNMGCAQANRVDNDSDPNTGAVILTFGAPVAVDTELTVNGASMFGSPSASVIQIEDAAKDYSRGFYNCLNESTASVQYVLAIGVTNDYPSSWTVDRVGQHGQAWGTMVQDVRDYQSSQGYSAAILSAGAADVEAQWSGPTRGRRWVNEFDGIANAGLLWNFGSANGCPWFGLGGTSCDNGWDQQDYYYISWDVAAGVPAPQVYRNDGVMAEQWVLISKWGNDNTFGGPMIFRGPLSQDMACAQVGCGSTLDNTPTQAWNQMVNAMDARPATIVDMDYSLDIRWRVA